MGLLLHRMGLQQAVVAAPGGPAITDYDLNSFTPDVAFVPEDDFYYSGGVTDFDGMTGSAFTRSTTAQQIDISGAPVLAAINEARVEHHVGGVLAGMLVEKAATRLLASFDPMATQDVTVTAQSYTIHFTGPGTITLSGASTAGPLVGTGTGESNRVSLTFTPTAGTLTLTVSGSVVQAQLETGGVRSSVVPGSASPTARGGESLIFPGPVMAAAIADKAGTPKENLVGWVNSNFDNFTSISAEEFSAEKTVAGGTDHAWTTGTFSIDATQVWYIEGSVTSNSSSNARLQFSETTNIRSNSITLPASGAFSGFLIPNSTRPSATLSITTVDTGLIEAKVTRLVKVTMPAAFSVVIAGYMTYEDLNSTTQFAAFSWNKDSNNRTELFMDTSSTLTGEPSLVSKTAGSLDTIKGTAPDYVPGANVPFAVGTRNLTNAMNVAHDGTAAGGDTTAVTVPDLVTTDFVVALNSLCTIGKVLIFFDDIGDTGLVEGTA